MWSTKRCDRPNLWLEVFVNKQRKQIRRRERWMDDLLRLKMLAVLAPLAVLTLLTRLKQTWGRFSAPS